MKGRIFGILALVGVLTILGWVAYSLAGERVKGDSFAASNERGKKLYHDSKLGNNPTGMSCNSCHPGGKTTGGEVEMMGMKLKIPSLTRSAATFPKVKGPDKMMVTLSQMNNMCLTMMMKGQPLDLNSQEAVDLATYVSSFSKGKKYNPGGEKK